MKMHKPTLSVRAHRVLAAIVAYVRHRRPKTAFALSNAVEGVLHGLLKPDDPEAVELINARILDYDRTGWYLTGFGIRMMRPLTESNQ